MNDIVYSNELELANGDFKVGESTNQHVKHILISNKGEYKQHPELGAAMENMLNSEDAMDFLIEAKKNLKYDGMKVRNISFTSTGTINVNATYING